MNINNLNLFLNELAASAVLPTTKAIVKIIPITVKQIKDVVDNTLLVPYFDVGFKQSAMTVFENNLTFDESVTNKEVTEFDFNLLFPYLKYDGEYDGEPIRNFVDKPLDVTNLSLDKEITYKNFTFKLKSPTLKLLREHQDFIINKLVINNEQIENEQEISTIYYVSELSKYVGSIIYEDKDLLQDQSIENRLKIIEGMPYQVATQILDFSSNLEQFIDSHLKNNDKTLSLDMSFFS
jgi:hypothetical protein